MKTKEINCWINSEDVITSSYIEVYRIKDNCEAAFSEGTSIEAKLTFELPENKITINQSEYDELLEIRFRYEGVCK